MRQSHFVRSAIALSMLAMSMAPASHAAELVGSASLSLGDLRMRLIDLTPEDGIAPSITFQGGWSASQSVGDPVTQQMAETYSYYIPFTSEQFLQGGQGYLFGDGANLKVLAPGEVGYVDIHAAGFDAAAVLTTDGVTSATVQRGYSQTYPGVDEQGNPVLNTYTYDNRRLLGGGYSEVGLISHSESGMGDGGGPFDPGFLPATFTLSANTLLVIEGTVSSTLAADRSSLVAAAEGWPTGGLVSSLSATGTAMVGLDVSLLDNMDLLYAGTGYTSHGTLFSMSHQLNYGNVGFEVPLGDDEVVSIDPAMTSSVSYSDNMQLVYANIGDSARELGFSVRSTVLVKQLVDGTYQDISTVSTPAIPEPGTYAMMGLGLAGLLLARRRAQLS